MRRIAAWAGGVLLALTLVALVGIGWYYSGEILETEPPAESDYDVEVLAAGDGTVTLEATDESVAPGRWGLDAPEAYAQVGALVAQDGDSVTRRLTPIAGQLRPGDLVDVDGYAYPQDPDAAFDFPVERVQIPGPLGQQPAWLAPGDADRWAVLVHGRGARRNECFRMLPILHAQNISSLCVSYRNDPGGPADPDGIYRQGEQEWRDVVPALEFALEQGAEDLVLVGFSMGGQITANLLRHAEVADEVDAVIWDAPLLDWGPVIGAGAQERGVPSWLVPIGMQASEWRAGVDYADLNQIEHAEAFDVPILLFHGTADTTVPVSVSDEFAKAAGGNLTYERVDGAGHVQAWNLDPRGYAAAVNELLDTALAGP